MPPSRGPRPGLGSRAKGQSPDSRLSANPAFPRRWPLRVRSPVTEAGPCRTRTGFLDPFAPCLSLGSIAGLPARVNHYVCWCLRRGITLPAHGKPSGLHQIHPKLTQRSTGFRNEPARSPRLPGNTLRGCPGQLRPPCFGRHRSTCGRVVRERWAARAPASDAKRLRRSLHLRQLRVLDRAHRREATDLSYPQDTFPPFPGPREEPRQGGTLLRRTRWEDRFRRTLRTWPAQYDPTLRRGNQDEILQVSSLQRGGCGSVGCGLLAGRLRLRPVLERVARDREVPRLRRHRTRRIVVTRLRPQATPVQE